MTRLALSVALLVALTLPAAAPGQNAPTLTAAPGNGFPDRQYVLRLPSPRALDPGDVTVTENGAPVSGQVGVEPVGAGSEQVAAHRFLLTYRSVLPPETEARVRASVAGLPAATARYTTPELSIEPRGEFEESWSDSLSITTFQLILLVLLPSALGLWVVARVRRL